ncbi:MAG: hypothetical protein IJ849_06245 [Selenomonadaceae bacterium]|nr:hypothetical protein [Selenomonadaceae bacterium]
MRVLLDTNIVLDYLGGNQGFTEDADKVFELGKRCGIINISHRGHCAMQFRSPVCYTK